MPLTIEEVEEERPAEQAREDADGRPGVELVYHGAGEGVGQGEEDATECGGEGKQPARVVADHAPAQVRTDQADEPIRSGEGDGQGGDERGGNERDPSEAV